MDRELRSDVVQSRAAFREMVKGMSMDEIGELSDSLRERVDNLVEELQVLSERVVENRERMAAIVQAHRLKP